MSTWLAAAATAAGTSRHAGRPTVSGAVIDWSTAAAALTPATLPCCSNSFLLATKVSQLEAIAMKGGKQQGDACHGVIKDWWSVLHVGDAAGGTKTCAGCLAHQSAFKGQGKVLSLPREPRYRSVCFTASHAEHCASHAV